MNDETREEQMDPDQLKYYRHPYQSTYYYGAYGPNRLRIKRGEQWGEFDRNGNWLAGELRSADPTFCRWVTGEHLYNARLVETKAELYSLTRLGASNARKT